MAGDGTIGSDTGPEGPGGLTGREGERPLEKEDLEAYFRISGNTLVQTGAPEEPGSCEHASESSGQSDGLALLDRMSRENQERRTLAENCNDAAILRALLEAACTAVDHLTVLNGQCLRSLGFVASLTQ